MFGTECVVSSVRLTQKKSAWPQVPLQYDLNGPLIPGSLSPTRSCDEPFYREMLSALPDSALVVSMSEFGPGKIYSRRNVTSSFAAWFLSRWQDPGFTEGTIRNDSGNRLGRRR